MGEQKEVRDRSLLGKIYKHGKVFRAKNKTFGTHDLLCLQVPDCSEKSVRFFPLYRPDDTDAKDTRGGLYLSSVKADKVCKTWKSLEEYFRYDKFWS